ncbi:hypothetical protein [Nocardioides houyundeii]|uniref:hypothetical protein n=1 Tax=Nocardioides houyundeii TaxID=2045452 RepID=UPI000C77AB03|nr:hypothetical protein [Nocardioides houyundeii]
MSVRRPLTSARGPLPALVCLLALLLGACAEDPEPKIAAPSESTSASASPSESVSEAAPPADETPEEFIQRWVDTDREMQNTGDTEKLEQITSGCVPCGKTSTQVASFYAAGGFVEWGGMKIDRIEKVTRLVYEVWGTSLPTRYKRSAEAQVERLPGGPTKYRVFLKRGAQGLVLADVAQRPL